MRSYRFVAEVTFIRAGVTQSVALDISIVFDIVWHTGLFHNFKPYEISSELFGFVLPLLSNKQLSEVLDGKSS